MNQIKARQNGITPADKLAALNDRALDKWAEILALPSGPDDWPDTLTRLRVLRLQNEATQSIVKATIRVDDSQLRAQQREDTMALLAKKMMEAEKKLPPEPR